MQLVAVSPEVLRDLRSRAEAACSRARDALSRAGELVAESRSLCPAHNCPRYFVVHGEVDGRPARAVWSRFGLLATEALARRGAVLVAIGEEFADPRGSSIRADLSQPAPALLTLVRACDRVSFVQFGPLVEARSAPT